MKVVLAVFCGLGALVGHLWPVFLGFRGGKGVATMGGILFAMNWMAALIAMGVWVVVFLPFRYVSLGSVVAALSLPVANELTAKHFVERWRAPWIVSIFFGIAAVLVIYRHKGNIGRLLNGTEKKFGRKKEEARA